MADQYVGPSEAPDRYRLTDRVGSGAEGEVWRAELASGPVAATVAVKVLRAPDGGAWTAAWRDRIALLRSEAQPGVVKVRESFVGPPAHLVTQADVRLRPELFLVSEWIDGSNLRTWASGRTDQELRTTGLALLAEVAAELDELHGGASTGGRPVVHLDLKPDNVLVDRAGRAWLGDFGLNRVLGISAAPDAPRAGYIAPEVRRGGDHWPASDRYALGGLAYFLVTRRDPPADPLPGQLRNDLLSSPVLAGSPAAADRLLEMLDPEPRQRSFPSRAWADAVVAAAAAPAPGPVGPDPAATWAGPAVPVAPTAFAPPPPPTADAPPPPPTAFAPPPPPAPSPPGGFGVPPTPAFVPAAPAKPRRTALILVVALVALVVIGAGAFLATRGGGSSSTAGSSDSADSSATTDPPTTDAPATDSPTTRRRPSTTTTTAVTVPPTTVPAALCTKVADIKAVTTEIQASKDSGNLDQQKAAIAHGAQIFADLAAVAPPEISADANFVAGSWYRYSQALNGVVPGNQATIDAYQAANTAFAAENDGQQVKNVDAYLSTHC